MNTLDDLPQLPAIVTGPLVHRRVDPIRHGFRHRTYQWLVDLDDIPVPADWRRWVCRFDTRDHLGGTLSDSFPSIRQNLERFARTQGFDVSAGRIVMLANARVAGFVFDPLTVFWCFGPQGSLTCVIAEVHNTYGERHAYVVVPDGRGTATVDKALYVSPFNDVSGRYRMEFCLEQGWVRTSVTLERPGRGDFEARFEGTAEFASASVVSRTVLRHPLMPQRIWLMIRVHGVWLWARRLPVVRRMPHLHQDGVA